MALDYEQMMNEVQPSNPFPGLRPFQFEESLLFFGRDGQSEQLIRKLSATRFLAVVGTSGSGKSSLVRAGLLPALFGGFMMSAGSDWRMAIMRPTNDPIGSLARALVRSLFGLDDEAASLQAAMIEATLRRGSLGLVEAVRQARLQPYESVLVVVDQFEELFRFARVTGDERYQNDAFAFVKLLLEASRQREVPIYIVLTMRSDFLGDCSIFWDLPEAINEGQYLIPRLTREQRSEAITGPVAVCGGRIAPRLVNRLLNDMGDNPDQLPILQHALMRAWERWRENLREGEPVDLRHYEAIGTMASALSWHADEAYDELPDDRSRKIAEKIFKALTEKGQDNREVRRPTELKYLCALAAAEQSEVVAVIETFRKPGRSFLMPPAGTPLGPDSLIDISHESLIRNWDKLKEWVDEEARSARIYGRLAETAALNKKGEAGLWHDPDLQLALNWREEAKPNEFWAGRYNPEYEDAMSFLDRSVARRDAVALEKDRRRRKEARRNKIIAATFAILFIATLTALVLANHLRLQARKEAVRERDMLYVSDVNRAQLAFDDNNFLRAQELLADHADEEEKPLRGFEWYHLWREMHRDRATLKGHAGAVNTVAVSPDGRTIASGSADRTVKLWDVESGQMVATLGGHKDSVIFVAFSPDGKMLASGSRDQTVKLWDIASRSELQTFKGQGTPIALVFSPDNKLLASGTFDGAIKVWTIGSDREPLSFKPSAINTGSIKFLPDGRLAAYNSWPGGAGLLDLKTQKILSEFNDDDMEDGPITFSPSGNLLAILDENKTVTVWDVNSHKHLATLRGHLFDINSIVFSPDERRIATASEDNTARLWDIYSRAEIASFKGHGDVVKSVAFSPDGSLLVSGSDDGTLKIWDAAPHGNVLAFQSEIENWAIAPDKNLLATIDMNGIKQWDINPEQIVGRKDESFSAVLPIAYSPDGKLIASSDFSGLITIRDASPQRELFTFQSLEDNKKLLFSPDGKILAILGSDNSVKLWDIDSRQEMTGLGSDEIKVSSIALSPDGNLLALGNAEGTVKLWDLESHKTRTMAGKHQGEVYSLAFSPDGSMLASGSWDYTAKLWDVDSQRELATLKGHGGAVRSIAFSPDGKRMATAGEDKFVRLWVKDLQRELMTIKCEIMPTFIAFSSDGKRLIGGGNDGIQVWLAATDEEVNALR